MKAADYVINRLADLGIEHAFGTPGACLLPIDDAIEFSSRKREVCTERFSGNIQAPCP
jgi:TPP-dependent 2-oxoacid decarboxylase